MARLRWGLTISLCLTPVLLLSGFAPDTDKTYQGLATPSQTLNLGFNARGRLDTIEFDRGDTIPKGALVAQLDVEVETATMQIAKKRSQADAQIRSAEARERSLRRRLENLQKLRADGVVSRDELDEIATETELARLQIEAAKHQQEVAELEYKRAVADLNQRRLFSPVGGVVIERLAQPGELVEASKDSPVLRLAVLDPLHIEAFLPDRNYGQVKAGEEVQVTLFIAGKPVVRTARVKVVDELIDAASSTYGVLLELPNPDHELPAGARCELHW